MWGRLSTKCRLLCDAKAGAGGLCTDTSGSLTLPGKRLAASPDGSLVGRSMAALWKLALCDPPQHCLQLDVVFLFRTSCPQIGQTGVDHVLRSGKADLAWIQIRRARRGVDRRPDEIVGGHTQHQFLSRHVRRGGTERMQVYGLLERAQIQLDIPAEPIQFHDLFRRQIQRRDQIQLDYFPLAQHLRSDKTYPDA